MSDYKIRVKVEIVESQDSEENVPMKTKDGWFELNMSEEAAISIDSCEETLLKMNYTAMREAISTHLSEVSKKKTLEHGDEVDLVSHGHRYQVDGELGRFTFVTHCILRNGVTVYASMKDLFPSIGGNEWYRTRGFKEIALIYGMVDLSYNRTARLINRIRYVDAKTPARTLQENVESEGEALLTRTKDKCAEVLETHAFTAQGAPQEETGAYGQDGALQSDEDINEAAEFVSDLPAEFKSNPVPLELSACAVNITIDDVLAKKQKEHRDPKQMLEEKEKKKRKSVYNTITHIEHNNKKYVINSVSTVSSIPLIVAFLVSNNLLRYRLQFFVDGQKTLHASILKGFSWHKNSKLILDWYHLEEKCKKQLSMALKGRVLRNEVLEELKKLLWHGEVIKAQEYLQNMNSNIIRNKAERDILIGYLERNKDIIPCYSLRKQLKLRNSSNIGEKMNDVIVSERQKHNGMSWSNSGSTALASVTILKQNNEVNKWFTDNDLDFKLAA